MGGRGAYSASAGTKVRSGMQFENEYSNIFVRSVNYSENTVRFIEGFSPSAIHDAQTIPIKEFKKYVKRHGYKQTGYWD